MTTPEALIAEMFAEHVEEVAGELVSFLETACTRRNKHSGQAMMMAYIAMEATMRVWKRDNPHMDFDRGTKLFFDMCAEVSSAVR